METLFFVVIFFLLTGLICGTFMLWSLTYPISSDNTKNIPFLTIIIPARNEGRRLPQLLKSIKQQTWRAFEVIVVDDASEDNTVEVAKKYGAEVLENSHINNMTPGKSSACALGAKHAKGQWLMFLDADVQFVTEDSLEKILSSYQKQNSKGILSIQPYHKIEKKYENLSVIFNIIVLTGVNVFTIWKEKFKTAGSFGPCILCNKDDYDLSGGHESAKDSIMDDFALSEVFLAKHLPISNYGGKGILSMRMYTEGMQHLMEGWTKNLASASQSTHRFVMLLIHLWIFGAFTATASLMISLMDGNAARIIISILLYFLYGLHVLILGRKAGNFSPLILLFYPFLMLFFTVIFIYSLYRTHIVHSVMWKGRKIKV